MHVLCAERYELDVKKLTVYVVRAEHKEFDIKLPTLCVLYAQNTGSK